MMRIFLLFFALFFNFSAAVSGEFDHSLYHSLLQEYVQGGLVEYSAIASNRERLDEYLSALQAQDSGEFEAWPEDERKAFWINAYNAVTIEGILRNYPISYGGLAARVRFPQSSIRQISDFWDTVFTKIMGKQITLNQIEHQILREEFKDARVHFVLVCASIGCPLLENEAFLVEGLETRLETATSAFIRNSQKVRLDKENNVLYLSSLFDWYKQDFEDAHGNTTELSGYGKKDRGVVTFILKYLTENDKQFIHNNTPKIKYLDYDWSLNERK